MRGFLCLRPEPGPLISQVVENESGEDQLQRDLSAEEARRLVFNALHSFRQSQGVVGWMWRQPARLWAYGNALRRANALVVGRFGGGSTGAGTFSTPNTPNLGPERLAARLFKKKSGSSGAQSCFLRIVL